MNVNSERCPTCGTPKSAWLDDNCPTCLMRLGTPVPSGEALRADQVALAQARLAATRHLGDYELLEEIARGGMGAVYRARQVSLNRVVAVKVLLGGQFANASFTRRFQREAEAAASLNHPNIVSIYEVGEHESQPYFSMELIEGRSLADLIRDGPLPARRAAELLKTIAEAVHFAHGRGLLHRDLKPSNVVVDSQDVPHITDFGLAKRVDSLSPSEGEREKFETLDLTLTGQVLGTPNYMPPEQADPKRGNTTAASDVYSLGAILYQLLTGRAPFVAETLTQTLRLVVEAEPVSPRLLNPSVPRDLETICTKCLEKDPERRYASAQELADELGRCLRDEPIHARAVGQTGRLMRWCRRKPALASSLGVGATLLVVVVIGSPIALIRINSEREHAEAARKQEAALRVRAETAEQETEQQLYSALLEQARATVLSGEMGHRVKALDALRRAAAISNSVELRREVFAALALPDLRFERELPHGAMSTTPWLDPRFEKIAVGRGGGSVEIRSTADQSLLATLPASTNLPNYFVEWSPDGKYLAVKRDSTDGGARGDWEVWHVADARLVLRLRDLAGDSASFHPRLPRLIAGKPRGQVEVWDVESGRQISQFQLSGHLRKLRFAPAADRFAALSLSDQGSLVSVHDAATGETLATHVFASEMHAIAWHPGGDWLAAPDHSGAVNAMDARTSQTRVLGGHKAQAVTAVFSPEGDYLFTGGWEGELICWNTRTSRREFVISLDSDRMQLSANGRHCAVVTRSGVRIHALERPEGYRDFSEDLGERLLEAAFSPNGRWLAASATKRLGLWDLTGNGPGALAEEAYETFLYFTPDESELLASRGKVGYTAGFRWRILPPTNALAPPSLETLPLHRPTSFTIFSVHSNSVAMTTAKGSQLLTREQIETGPDRWLPTAPGLNTISPDGRWLAINAPFSSSVFIYRLPGMERVATLRHPANIAKFQFSPGADELAFVSRAGMEFWSTANWERTRVLTNAGRVRHIQYAPDGRGLWLAMEFRNGGLYDARTFQPVLLLPTGMLPLAISPDGRQLAVSVDLRRLRVWDLAALRTQFRDLGLDWEQERPTRASPRDQILR